MRAGVVLPLALAIAGCGAQGSTTSTPLPSAAATSAAATSASPTTPARCGVAAGDLGAAATAAAGRPVVAFAPAGYDPTGPARYPVVVALHGYDQQASTFAADTGVGTAGAALGALVLVPQGLGSPSGWNVPDDTSLYADDVGMIRSLVAGAVAQGCGDPARVVVAGLSDGADMAVTAACALPGVVRSVLLVAASTGPSPSCGGLGVVQVHGTADPVDAYTGRAADTRRGFGSVKAAGAEQAFALWAALDGCTGRTDGTTGDLRRLRGTGCAHPVELVAVQGGGHTWPSGRNATELGRTTTSTGSTQLLTEALAAG